MKEKGINFLGLDKAFPGTGAQPPTGDVFSNCGTKGSTYVQCNISDILCGSIQCENVTEISLLSDHSSVHWTHPDGVTCWGTDYHAGITIPHMGAMIECTECGKEHICIQRKYVHMSYMPRTYTPKTCNMNGVCNNRHHCHCDHEWNPPKDGVEGFGGSSGSGPPPTKKNAKIQKKFCIMLLGLIPFLIL
ncbi:disintegrin and metalloproteinase domain-containing protein 25-like, partial [Panthera onca]